MLRSIFVLCAFVVGGVAAVHSAFGALLFYLWFALFRPQEWLWIDITAYRPSLVIGLVLMIRSLAAGVLPNLTHPLSIGSVSFLLAALVAQHGAVNQALGWYWFDFLWKLVLVALFLTSLTNTRTRGVVVMAVMAASFGFFPAKAGLVSALRGGLQFGEGTAGAFIDNNAYAVGSVMTLCLMAATAQNVSSKWLSRAFWLAVPLTAMTVVSTFSRAGFLALSTAALVFILFQRRRWLLLSLAVAVIPLVLVVAPIPQRYFDRLQTIRTYNEVDETSALSRLYFWRVALRMSANHPLGVGLWNFQSMYDTYDTSGGVFGHGRAVHNSFLQALTETGWFGGALYAGMVGYAGFLCVRANRRGRACNLSPPDARFLATAGAALLAALVGFAVGGFFVSMAYNDLTWLLFGVVAALDRMSKVLCKGAGTDLLEPVSVGSPA